MDGVRVGVFEPVVVALGEPLEEREDEVDAEGADVGVSTDEGVGGRV
jgi:hypothetical protein